MYNNLDINTHKIWDIMKSQNLQIIVVEEEETQVKGAELIFRKIIEVLQSKERNVYQCIGCIQNTKGRIRKANPHDTL